MKAKEYKEIISMDHVYQMIYFIRGEKVLSDRDLAKLYEVDTKVLM